MPEPPLAQSAREMLAELCTREPMGYVPSIHWRPYRVTAGMAYYRLGTIGLSIHVLRDEQALRDTLTHEYAHLLAVHRHGRRASGHGEAWRRAMRDLGAEPKVRHNYEVTRNVPRQQVTYLCVKCGAEILRRRKLPRRRQFVHLGCGGAVRLKQVEKL